MLTTSCHCGSVKIEIESKPEILTQCTCSICRRYAALWVFYTTKTATVKATPGALKAYCWNDKVIEFYHCVVCGCLTHYKSVEKSDDSRVAINARMMAPIDIEGIKVRTFDGADTWKFLDE